MKKNIICISLLSSTLFLLVSCSSTSKFTQIAQNLLNASLEYVNNANNAANNAANGEEMKYQSGSFTVSTMVYDNEKKEYVRKGEESTYMGTVTLNVFSDRLTMSMPAAMTSKTDGLSKVVLTDLKATNGIYKISEESTCTSGTYRRDGKTFNLANAYVEMKYTATTLKYDASLYFDLDETTKQYNYCLNIKYLKQ